ncbi:MAG: hypothetical protein KAJ63_01655, partial [Methyloprofundus sp.]|nr:hypothetical protein [Methyloprofundus sp.]
IFAAVPRFISALYLLYPAQINEHYKKNVDSVDLNHHIKSAEYAKKALDWFESGSSWQTLTLSKARQLDFVEPSMQYKISQEIYQTNAQGLALSPIDPYAWYRFAATAKSMGLADKKIIDSLRLSCYAGRVEPELLLKRVTFLHRYFRLLDNEMLEILYDQIRLSSLLRQRDLVKLVRQRSSLLPIVHESLQYDLELLNNFQQLFEKTTLKN